MTISLLLVGTVLIALCFDLINGFHDAANSIATVVATRVLRPSMAVLWAAFFNFMAVVIFAPRVADTISKIIKIQSNDPIFIFIILCGLLSAIFWDLLTWWLGLPTSSSHALIGGLSGAGLAHMGLAALNWETLIPTMQFIILAPLIGFVLGTILIILMSWSFKDFSPGSVDYFFRKGQLASAALYSIGHGANDAQKTMGVILALLIASGTLAADTELSLTDPRTAWIILSCQLAISLGTALGGWRIVKTMGMKIAKLRPVDGFCAEMGGALTLFFATHAGIPVSTTQTIASSIMGVGSVGKKISGARWGIAKRIVWSWLLTLPCSGMVGAFYYYLGSIFNFF